MATVPVISIAVVKRDVIDFIDFLIIVTPFIGGGLFLFCLKSYYHYLTHFKGETVAKLWQLYEFEIENDKIYETAERKGYR